LNPLLICPLNSQNKSNLRYTVDPKLPVSEAVTDKLPIQSVLLPVSELNDMDANLSSQTLGIIRFNDGEAENHQSACPDITVPLKQLNPTPLAEVWIGQGAVEYHSTDNIAYAKNGSALFACLYLDQLEPGQNNQSLEQAAFTSYQHILELLEKEQYLNLLRTWNYFSDINKEQNGIERYQSFCVGRLKAFTNFPLISDKNFPAATVIGTHKGRGVIYFIASKEPGLQIENPRQTSAYQYPAEYGPVSPSFSRSLLKRWDQAIQLYISGTASIVGHETQHKDQYMAQFDEIILNLQALIANVGQLQHFNAEFKNITPLKVYLRDPGYLNDVKSRLQEIVGDSHPVLYLHGDICRRNLLLEAEGILRGTTS
jgi:chorismate lyase/3-hydroxybenzoate synthase